MKCYTVIFANDSNYVDVRNSIWVNAKNEILGIRKHHGYEWLTYTTSAGMYLTDAYLRQEKVYGVEDEIGNVYDEFYFVKCNEANMKGILLYIIIPTNYLEHLIQKANLTVIDTKFSSSQEVKQEFINITATFNGNIGKFIAIAEGAL